MGKRILTLSPQLELLHEFRGEPTVPGALSFWAMAARGDKELLVTNDKKVHVLTVA